MDLKVIAEARFAEELKDLYCGNYQKLYGIRPVLMDEDSATFGWLSSKFPKQDALAVVDGYFKLPNRYVMENMHPVSLLKRNVNPALAVGRKKTSCDGNAQNALVVFAHYCTRCGSDFKWVGRPSELGTSHMLCDKCRVLPLPTISDFEEARQLVGSTDVAERLLELVSKAIAGTLSDGEFGRFAARMINDKLNGRVLGSDSKTNVDWSAYCKALYMAQCIIDEVKKEVPLQPRVARPAQPKAKLAPQKNERLEAILKSNKAFLEKKETIPLEPTIWMSGEEFEHRLNNGLPVE